MKICPHCSQAFDELVLSPRLLSCGHPICSHCAETAIASSTHRFTCTVNQPHEVNLPSSLADLPVYYSLLNILLADSDDAPAVLPICETCALDNGEEAHSATKRCIECQEDMCDTAAAFHARSKASRDHRVLGLAELTANPKLSAARMSTFCAEHKSEQFRYFDKDCGRIICRDCQALHHKSHTCVSLPEISKQYRVELEHACKRAQTRIAELTHASYAVTAMADMLNCKRDQEEVKIRNTFQTIRSVLDQREAEILQMLSLKHASKASNLTAQHELLQTFASCLDATIERVKISSDSPSDVQFMLAHPLLSHTLHSLTHLPVPLNPQADSALEFFMQVDPLLSAISASGSIVDRATCAALSFASGLALELARPGATSAFLITACDLKGSARGVGGDDICAELIADETSGSTAPSSLLTPSSSVSSFSTASATVWSASKPSIASKSAPVRRIPVALIDNKDGTYSGSYTLPADAFGRYSLSIKIQDEPIKNSPFVIDIDTANLVWDPIFTSDGSTASEFFSFSDNALSATKTNDAIYIQTIRSNKSLAPGVSAKWRFRIDQLGQNLDIGFGRNCGKKSSWIRGLEIFGDFCISEPIIKCGDLIEISVDQGAGKAWFRRVKPFGSGSELLKEVVFDPNGAPIYALAAMSAGCSVSFH